MVCSSQVCRPNTAPTNPNANARCQKCLQPGHWTFDCKNDRTYRPRPTRTALLANPALSLPEARLEQDDIVREREWAAAEILAASTQDRDAAEARAEDDKNEESSDYTTDDDDDEYTTDDEEASESSGFSDSEDDADTTLRKRSRAQQE